MVDFPAVVDVERAIEGGASFYLSQLYGRCLADWPDRLPPVNAEGHIGQGGIMRGLHRGESCPQMEGGRQHRTVERGIRTDFELERRDRRR